MIRAFPSLIVKMKKNVYDLDVSDLGIETKGRDYMGSAPSIADAFPSTVATITLNKKKILEKLF